MSENDIQEYLNHPRRFLRSDGTWHAEERGHKRREGDIELDMKVAILEERERVRAESEREWRGRMWTLAIPLWGIVIAELAKWLMA